MAADKEVTGLSRVHMYNYMQYVTCPYEIGYLSILLLNELGDTSKLKHKFGNVKSVKNVKLSTVNRWMDVDDSMTNTLQ